MRCTGPKPQALLVLAGLALSQIACVGILHHERDLEHYLSNNLTAEALYERIDLTQSAGLSCARRLPIRSPS